MKDEILQVRRGYVARLGASNRFDMAKASKILRENSLSNSRKGTMNID